MAIGKHLESCPLQPWGSDFVARTALMALSSCLLAIKKPGEIVPGAFGLLISPLLGGLGSVGSAGVKMDALVSLSRDVRGACSVRPGTGLRQEAARSNGSASWTGAWRWTTSIR